jgi:nicotinamide riboside transporter PnuC
MSDPRWTWVFTLMGLITMWLLTRKNRWGFAVAFVKECVWVPYGYVTRQYGFVASGILFAVVAARGYLAWSARSSDAHDE